MSGPASPNAYPDGEFVQPDRIAAAVELAGSLIRRHGEWAIDKVGNYSADTTAYAFEASAEDLSRLSEFDEFDRAVVIANLDSGHEDDISSLAYTFTKDVLLDGERQLLERDVQLLGNGWCIDSTRTYNADQLNESIWQLLASRPSDEEILAGLGRVSANMEIEKIIDEAEGMPQQPMSITNLELKQLFILLNTLLRKGHA